MTILRGMSLFQYLVSSFLLSFLDERSTPEHCYLTHAIPWTCIVWSKLYRPLLPVGPGFDCDAVNATKCTTGTLRPYFTRQPRVSLSAPNVGPHIDLPNLREATFCRLHKAGTMQLECNMQIMLFRCCRFWRERPQLFSFRVLRNASVAGGSR